MDKHNTNEEFAEALARCRQVLPRNSVTTVRRGAFSDPRLSLTSFYQGQTHTHPADNRRVGRRGGYSARIHRHCQLWNYRYHSAACRFADQKDMSAEHALELYDCIAHEAMELMIRKNTDYNEAWRDMRVLSYDDFILTKIARTKEIEDNAGVTRVSEGIDANYFDIINYAVFGIIKLTEDENCR